MFLEPVLLNLARNPMLTVLRMFVSFCISLAALAHPCFSFLSSAMTYERSTAASHGAFQSSIEIEWYQFFIEKRVYMQVLGPKHRFETKSRTR